MAREHEQFETSVRQALDMHMPFIVQRLGRFACVVPPLPTDLDESRAVIEARLGLDDTDDNADATVLYDAVSALDALAIWTRFMHDAWAGRVHHAPMVRLQPLLAALLGNTD